MSIIILCAAVLAGGGFSAAFTDGGQRVVLSSTRSVADSARVRCRWTVLMDALPAATGWWPVSSLAAGAPITNRAPGAVAALRERGGDFSLQVRFVTGEEEVKDETLLSLFQYDYPRQQTRPLSAFAGKPAELRESAGTYEFKTSSTRIRFDRATGLLSGFATGWWSETEWLKRPMAFDFGDPSPRVRMETFTKPSETNGVWSFRTVSWWSIGTESPKKNFELRVTTDWQVRGDGRVVSETVVRPFGLVHILPRVGWAFVLAPPDPLVQYYGRGPAADSKDAFHQGLTGLYSCTVAGCGSHDATRGVAFDAGSDHFGLSTLGGNFFLELGKTPSKATFCGLSVAQNAETDRDFKIDLLISPEKTLKALAPPARRAGDGSAGAGEDERRETGDKSKSK